MLNIYKSSAGSGKTYTLVREYLRIAFERTDKYRNILAITFTNKAAAEMKSRILEALEGIATEADKYQALTQDLAQATNKNEATLRTEASAILSHILHNYSDISVSTIDSFVHKIVRSFAYDLHLSMSFNIEMDSNKLLQEAVELLFERLDEEDKQITQAVIDFADGKMEDGKGWNVEFELQKLGRQLFVDSAMPYIQQLDAVDLEKMNQVKQSLSAQRVSFEQKVFAIGQRVFTKTIEAGYSSADFFQTSKGPFGFFQKYAEGKLPNDIRGNSFVKKCLVDDDWGKKSQVDDGIKNEMKLGFQQISELWDTEGKDYYLCDLLLRNFYAFILLTDIQKLVEEIKKKDDVLHIGDFQHKVFEIVKEQDAPIIYERIGERYDSILIDEFQDTSVIQWRNLLPLIENSQFKSEDSLIVGDGKQAIYRFRGGEVEQFAELPKVYGSHEDDLLKQREVAINNYGAKVHVLGHNYRSCKEIIDFNNHLYKTILDLPELKHKAIYEDYFQSQGKEKSGGYVRVEFWEDEDDIRCERVEEIIQEVMAKGYKWKDVAVLCRTNKHASVIASYLVNKSIRVLSPESLLIDQSPKVQLLLASFNYLSQKENIIARAEILSYIKLLNHADVRLEQVDYNLEYHAFDLLISSFLTVPFLSDNFSVGRLTDLVHELVHCFALDDDDPFVQFFLDEILLYSSRYGNTLRDFLQWWQSIKFKKSIIYPESMDAVNIMTIHKSKGLQFPIVILADAIEKKKLMHDFFWVPLHKSYAPQLPIGLLPCNKLMLETEFASLYEKEEDQSFLDLLNLLYVGTTRAEDALYILSEELKEMPKENNSVTALLIAALQAKREWDGFDCYAFGQLPNKLTTSKKEESKFATYTRDKVEVSGSKSSAIKVKVQADLLWSDATTGKIDAGNLLHDLLSQIKYVGDEDAVIRKLKADAWLSAEQTEEVAQQLKAIVYHPELAQYFQPEVKVFNERSLIRHDSKTRIPDRIIVSDNQAVILDYKTGKEKDSYRQQLNDYAQWLSEAGFVVEKKLIYYTALNKLEEVI